MCQNLPVDRSKPDREQVWCAPRAFTMARDVAQVELGSQEQRPMFALLRLWQRVGGWRALVAQLLLTWRLFWDGRVPWTAKAIPALALIYFVSPINLSFEWIPIIGQIDDLTIVLLGLGLFFRLCPDELVREHAAFLEREMTTNPRYGVFNRMGGMGRFLRPSFRQWTSDQDDKRRNGSGR